MIKITHLTSAHPRYDTRIFIKMCSSLAKKNEYVVNLVVADGKGDESKNKINIYDIGKKDKGRLSRMTKTVQKVYVKAIKLDSDIYHLHDPELIPIGIKLKRKGKKVIFDAHEDLPKQILGKPYLNKFTSRALSLGLTFFEKITCKKFDCIITATPYIRDKFLKINKNSVDINNFPIIRELNNKTLWSEKKNEVCYIGGISENRGIKEIVKALELTKGIKLNLVGTFQEDKLRSEIKTYKGWEKVNELGFLNRKEVASTLSQSKAGIVTLYPLINYLDSLPVKMFEYMLAGLPVISSNIKLWKKIIEENKCGICVDPHNPVEIAEAIKYITENPQKANEMGKNGKKAILEKYNWDIEENKLLSIYQEITKTILNE